SSPVSSVNIRVLSATKKPQGVERLWSFNCPTTRWMTTMTHPQKSSTTNNYPQAVSTNPIALRFSLGEPYFITTRDVTRVNVQWMESMLLDVKDNIDKANGEQDTADRIQSELSSVDAQLRQLQQSWVGQTSLLVHSVTAE